MPAVGRLGLERLRLNRPQTLGFQEFCDAAHAAQDVAPAEFGQVEAGPAMLAEENRLGELLVDQTIASRGRCFALRVSGDSMVGAGMNDGDVVICRQQPVAESGEIVVALLGEEATVKRLYIHGDRIELRPENKRYKPIVIGPDDNLSILGKVVAARQSGDPPEF
jgi:repressor LexA